MSATKSLAYGILGFLFAASVTTCGEVAIRGALDGTSKALATDELPRNGCPLDSVRYESPTFGFDCYRVTDRISGESWWLVRMGSPSEWVVMSIEGKVQDMG